VKLEELYRPIGLRSSFGGHGLLRRLQLLGALLLPLAANIEGDLEIVQARRWHRFGQQVHVSGRFRSRPVYSLLPFAAFPLRPTLFPRKRRSIHCGELNQSFDLC
jgi:hypothetical protein